MKVIFCLLFCAGMLAAQNTTPDTLFYNLDAVTVTATRYSEKVMEIPYAVTILKDINKTGLKGYGIDEALNTIPGVTVQSRAGGQDVRLTIRGYGARGAGDRSNSGTSRGVRIMTDGIPETEPDGRTSFDMLDMSLVDQAEVIRSNASALWGNAAGGVINFRSIPLGLNPFYSAQFSAGSFGLKKYVAKTFFTAEKTKIYFGFTNTQTQGYRKHSDGKRSIAMLSVLSEFAPLSNLGVYLVGSSSLFHIPGPLSLAQYNADPSQANPIYLSRDERRYNRLGRIGMTLDYSFTEHRQLSAMAYANPKYLQRSERGTFRDFTRYHVGGNIVFKETQKFGDDINNTTSLGVDEAYQDGAILFYTLSATNGRGTTLRDNKREGANTFGAFVQNETTFDERLSILVGARFDKVTYYSENYLNQKLGLQDKSFERVTPKVGVTYRITPQLSVYANVGGGVEVPAGNETDPAGTFGQDTVYLLNPLLEPINSTSFEAGVKHIIRYTNHSVLRGLSYEAAVYRINISDDIIPYSGGRFYFTAGKTSRTGAELSLEANLHYGLSLNVGFTYINAKYDEYRVDSVHYNKNKAGIFAVYDGNKSAGIPGTGLSLGLGYTPAFAKYLKAGLTLQQIGKYYADDANKYEVPSYTIYNFTLSTPEPIMLTDNLGIKLSFSALNISDAKYAASAFINPDLVNNAPVYLEPGLPAHYMFGVQIVY